MNSKRYIGATLALFAFLFFYEWLVHGLILSNMYHDTPHVWRTMKEMTSMMPLYLLINLAISAWLALIFTRFFKDGGVENGLRFGLYFGVFSGLIVAMWYLWLPVSGMLAFSWLINGIVEGLGGGYVLGLVYRK